MLRLLAVLAATAFCSHAMANRRPPPVLAVDSACHRLVEDEAFDRSEAAVPGAAGGGVRFGLAARCAVEGLLAGGSGALARGAAQGFRDALLAAGRGLAEPVAVSAAVGVQIAHRGVLLRETGGYEWQHFRSSMAADPHTFAGAVGRFLGVLAVAALCAGLLAYIGRVLHLLYLQARYPHVRFGDRAVRLAGRLFPRRFGFRLSSIALLRPQSAAAAFARARAALLARRKRQRVHGVRRLTIAVRNGVADLAAAVRNLIAGPRAAIRYWVLRAGEIAGRGAAALGAGLWSALALALVPVLLILQEPIADAAERLGARDRLMASLRTWQAESVHAPTLDTREVQAGVERLAAGFEAYRLRLLAPLGEVEADFERDLAQLDAAVEQWNDAGTADAPGVDGVVDARLDRILQRYALRRLQLIQLLNDATCAGQTAGRNCSAGFRLAAYDEEIALLSDWEQRLGETGAAPVRARIARLDECLALEQHDYREGEHDALIKRALSGCPSNAEPSRAG